MKSGISSTIALLVLAILVVPIFADRHTLILAGQSNMVGQGIGEGQGFPDSIPEIRVWNASGELSGSWMALRPGLADDARRFGIELTVGTTLLSALPGDTFVFLKTAWGGTSIAQDWLPPSSGGPGLVYSRMFQNIHLAQSRWVGEFPKLDGFLWMQGESDGCAESSADKYRQNLANFVRDVRETLKDTASPWVLGLIDLQPAWPYAYTIREAQVEVANDLPRMGVVETAGLATDGVHYTAEGLRELGRKMATRWLELKGYAIPVMKPGSRTWKSLSGGRLAFVDNGINPLCRVRLIGPDGHGGQWQRYLGQLVFPATSRPSRGPWFLQVERRDGTTEVLRVPPVWR